MKIKERFYSIRFKILCVYIILILITSFILLFSFFGRFETVYKKQAEFHMTDITLISAESITNMTDQIEYLSRTILIDQVVQDNLEAIKVSNAKKEIYGAGNVAAYETAISQQIRGNVLNVKDVISLRIYPKNGREIFIGLTNPEYLEYTMTEDEIYAANGAAIWEAAGGENCICIGRAILSMKDMQPLGYMVIVCYNEFLGDKLATISGAYSGKVYLVNEKNQIMTSSETESIGESFPYKLESLQKDFPMTIEDPVSGEPSYYAIGNDFENGWTLITTVSREQLSRNIFASFWQVVVISIVVFVLVLLFTEYVLRRLFVPVGELQKSMSAFGAGNLDARVDIQAKDEIGQIGESYNQMADNIQTLMEQVYELELANKEAEISFLKMQINPHFLYNSLDTISWLGFAAGNEEIPEISVALASLFRASIKRADMVTVREEIQTIKNYLLIQKYRFGDKIAVEWDIEEEVLDCKMPGFLLQPLVENSIIHGLEPKIEGGRMQICIFERDNTLCFSVSDDGVGIEPVILERLKKQCEENQCGDGIGLQNVSRRLKLLYGEACGFSIDSEPEKGTCISFSILINKNCK